MKVKQQTFKFMEDAGGAMESGGAGDPAMDASAMPTGSNGDAVAPANPDHPDQSEDIELFKQLITQYLGDGHADNGEAMKMCKEAFDEAMASGMPKDEAMKCAGYGLKCAHLLTQKESRMAQEAGMPADQANHSTPSPSNPGTPGLANGAIKEGKDLKESQLIALTAENARLKENNRKLEITGHLNKILEGCGVPTSATKVFRELVKDKRTTVEIDSAWKTFKSAFTETGKKLSSGFFFGIEKQPSILDGNSNSSTAGALKIGFADCIEKPVI